MKNKGLIITSLFILIIVLEVGTTSLVSFLFTMIAGYSLTLLLCLTAIVLVNKSLMKKWIMISICLFILFDHLCGAFVLKGLSHDLAFLTAANLAAYWPNFVIAGLAIVALIIYSSSTNSKTG